MMVVVAGVVVFVSAANRFAAALSCFSRFCFDIAMIDAIYLYSIVVRKRKRAKKRESTRSRAICDKGKETIKVV